MIERKKRHMYSAIGADITHNAIYRAYSFLWLVELAKRLTCQTRLCLLAEVYPMAFRVLRLLRQYHTAG